MTIELKTKRMILNNYVESKKEDDFVKEVLIPLFESQNYKVEYNQSAIELGKDLILIKDGDFGREVITVVVKNSNISNKGKITKSNEKLLEEIKRQVGQCWDLELTLNDGTVVSPNKVLFITSGSFSANVKLELEKSKIIKSNPNTVIWDQENLIPLVSKYAPNVFEFQLPSLATYLERLSESIYNHSTYEATNSKVLGMLELECSRTIPSPDKIYTSSMNMKKLVLEKKNDLWIQGSSGSGKSYSIYQVCQYSIDKLRYNVSSKELIIPLVIKAVEVTEDLLKLSEEELVFKNIKKYYSGASEKEVSDWVNNNEVIFFIDEVEKVKEFERINELRARFNKLKKVRFIFLSRLIEEIDLNIKFIYESWTLQDINLNKAISLIEDNITSDNNKAKRVLSDLKKNGTLEKVSRTPLAINVLSHLFSEGASKTPNNAWEFMDMFFELVLGRWTPEIRDTNNLYDYTQNRAFLQKVALRMIENRTTSIHFSEIEDIAENILNSVNEKNVKTHAYVKELEGTNEIFTFDNDYFEFKERYYLEFLAGCEYDKSWNNEFVIQNITDVGWEDVLIFAAGKRKDCNSLLENIDKVKEDTLTDNFMKVKNISLLTQALYHSSTNSKKVALKEGACTSFRLRDRDDFKEAITRMLKLKTEDFYSYMSLLLFNTFYGRESLAPIFVDMLDVDSREKYYYISAIVEADLHEDDIKRLNKSVDTLNLDFKYPEAATMRFFLEEEKGRDVKEEDLLRTNSVLVLRKNKKIKNFLSKITNYLNPKKSYEKERKR